VACTSARETAPGRRPGSGGREVALLLLPVEGGSPFVVEVDDESVGRFRAEGEALTAAYVARLDSGAHTIRVIAPGLEAVRPAGFDVLH
jgi:hypothetical protein